MSASPTSPVLDPKAKRIAFVIEKLAQRSGGAERVLVETANALSRRGHHVEIISHEYRGAPPFYATAPGVILSNLRMLQRTRWKRMLHPFREAMHRLPDLPVFDRAVWFSRNGAFWRRLQLHLRAVRPDVVIGFMPPAISAVALAKTDHRMRRVASMHNAPEQDFHNPARWDPSRLDRRRRLALMSKIDKIAVLLPEYRDWYPVNLQDRVLVLPNAVTPIAPEVLAASRRGHTVISVGRLATVKRHGILIDSWSRLAGRFPDWKLQIFGEGPIKAELEAQILARGLEGKVILMGHRSDIAQCYLTASILAHPAEFEGFPLAVTEALASGLPVVGFEDCSGLNRLVQDGVSGRLVSAEGDRVENFAKALGQLMADDELRLSLGAAGPSSVAAYAPDKVIDMWEEMLFGP
ncbi:glycosyltransferase family 4 protein [Cereibacter azotoformans]|uniref:glycosyltransferase family 4 protein n=1 Tax=Cereibacter azotoformans TaxID=43057 RepID=UPI000C6EA09A|nr:glycosyltransferase family 4 protein [Cereibacter azotoformans]